MNKLSIGVFRCSSVSEILKYIRAIISHWAPIRYGVEKVEGKSYDRLHLSRKAESRLVYRYWVPCTELRERNNPARMHPAVFHLYHSWTRIRQSAIAGYFLQQPLSLYASASIVLCSSSSLFWCMMRYTTAMSSVSDCLRNHKCASTDNGMWTIAAMVAFLL